MSLTVKSIGKNANLRKLLNIVIFLPPRVATHNFQPHGKTVALRARCINNACLTAPLLLITFESCGISGAFL